MNTPTGKEMLKLLKEKNKVSDITWGTKKYLFNNIYFRSVDLPSDPTRYYLFYHRCNPEGHYLYQIKNVVDTGTCGKCNTYILSYKKLEVMAALKELTG